MSYVVPLPSQEIEFFNLIKNECSVIFDVGVREDIDYLLNSYDKSRNFHFFEPNPKFLNQIYKKIEDLPETSSINHTIFLNQLGLGSEVGELIYYPDAQSFIFRKVHFQSSPSTTTFPISTIKNYCAEKLVDNIDFLKVDIEGMEIDCLKGGEEIINKTCKFVQFEFASTMLDRGIEPEELISFFDNNFDLFLLKVDLGHPFFDSNKNLLTRLNDELYQRIKEDMYNAYGCNFVAIKKELSNKYISE